MIAWGNRSKHPATTKEHACKHNNKTQTEMKVTLLSPANGKRAMAHVHTVGRSLNMEFEIIRRAELHSKLNNHEELEPKQQLQ